MKDIRIILPEIFAQSTGDVFYKTWKRLIDAIEKSALPGVKLSRTQEAELRQRCLEAHRRNVAEGRREGGNALASTEREAAVLSEWVNSLA